MWKLISLFVFVLFLPNISAICEDNQIDINTATQEELDELYGIGPVKAEAIIDSRPFQSVDDLIDVYGIGEVTLDKIKEQGLACVEEEEQTVQNNEKNVVEKKDAVDENVENDSIEKDIVITLLEDIVEEKEEHIKPEIIKLNPKDIKTEKGTENSDENSYAVYGFVLFCVLLGFLFLLKNMEKRKNEFS